MTAGRPRVPAPGRGRRSWAKLGAGRGPGLGAAVLPPGRGLAGRGGHGRGGFSPGVPKPRCPAFLLKKKRKKKSPPSSRGLLPPSPSCTAAPLVLRDAGGRRGTGAVPARRAPAAGSGPALLPWPRVGERLPASAERFETRLQLG